MYVGGAFRSGAEVNCEFEGLDKQFNLEATRELKECEEGDDNLNSLFTSIDH